MKNNPKASWQEWMRFALRWAITLAIIVAAGRRVWFEKAKLASYTVSPSPPWLIVSGAFYLVGLATCAVFWWSAMRDMGGRPTWTSTLAAYYAGQLGKYVPGKGLVLVVRATMVKGPGVEIAQAGITVVQETSLMMATGAIVSTLILLLVDVPHRGLLLVVSVALALGLGVVALPPIVFRLGSVVKKALPKVSTAALKPCRWKTVGVGALFITVGWLMVGLSLAAVLAAMHQLPPLSLHLSGVEAFAVLTGAIALATVGGFVSFTPGGLGAREWILAEMLTPVVGSEHAIVGAVMLRIVWIVTEAAAAGVLLMVDRQWNRSRTNPS
jgi:hypothetical protein